MSMLWPPLEDIEEELFGPSDELHLRRAQSGKSTASDSTGRANGRGYGGQSRAPSGIQQRSELAEGLPERESQSALPAFLQDAIEKRVAVASARFSRVPTEGQVLSVDRLIGPAGPLDTELNRPLAVCLDRPTSVKDVWSGWLASPEVTYAGYWDLVLEPDDEPFDPAIGIVQVWNPVRIYLPTGSRVLAELRPDRLQAVRALAAEFESGPAVDLPRSDPGSLCPRHLGSGHEVLTGTPTGNGADPRRRFQDLYREAAMLVGEPARLATPSLVDRLVVLVRETIRAALRSRGVGWEQRIEPAMAATSLAADDSLRYRLGEELDVTFTPNEQKAGFQVVVSLTGLGKYRVARIDATHQELESAWVEANRPARFFVRTDERSVLRLSDGKGIRYELPLQA